MGVNQAKELHSGSEAGAELLLYVQWERYKNLFTSSTSMYFIALFLVLMKESPLRKITRKVPESLVLILIGVAIGAVFYTTKGNTSLEEIDDQYLINFLLPPIILDSAYHIYSKQLLYQLDAVLAFAVVGTAFNILATGFSLYGVFGAGNGLSALDCLLFASIVSAVDPVAVLSVFGQLGVSLPLYIVIFGESLMNDGVTIVFFEGIERLAESAEVRASHYAFAFLSFFTVALGGLLIGFAMGIISALVCKCTSMKSRMLEPLIILLSAYFAFVLSQILHWSGFIALISCGLTQKRYAFPNLFEKTRVTVVEGTETLATMAEALIFLLLGIDCYIDTGWNIAFICWTVLFITVYRVVSVVVISVLLNLYRQSMLTYRHMFVMAYSGLRGAVSYALATSIERNRDLYVTTTLAVIFFTVFVQGGTIRFVVLSLDFVETKSKKDSFTRLVMDRVVFHSVAGMEAIMGGAGTRLHYWVERMELCDKKYFRRFVVIPSKDLTGLSDFLHHKELHKIYRMHNPGHKTKKLQADDRSSSSSEDSSAIGSETIFSSSSAALSFSSDTRSFASIARGRQAAESDVQRIRQTIMDMTPSKREKEKAKRLESYKNTLVKDHIQNLHSRIYRKHHQPSSWKRKKAKNIKRNVRKKFLPKEMALKKKKGEEKDSTCKHHAKTDESAA